MKIARMVLVSLLLLASLFAVFQPAATLAQDVVERLLAIDYVRDSVPLRSEFNTADNGNRAYPDPTGRYTIDWTVSGPDTPLDRAVTINVTVRWWAYGIPRRYNLIFIKTEEI